MDAADKAAAKKAKVKKLIFYGVQIKKQDVEEVQENSSHEENLT